MPITDQVHQAEKPISLTIAFIRTDVKTACRLHAV